MVTTLHGAFLWTSRCSIACVFSHSAAKSGAAFKLNILSVKKNEWIFENMRERCQI